MTEIMFGLCCCDNTYLYGYTFISKVLSRYVYVAYVPLHLNLPAKIHCYSIERNTMIMKSAFYLMLIKHLININ